MERYFEFYGLNEEEKVSVAVVGMDRDALLWYYQWEHRQKPIRSWETLKALMLRHFPPTSSISSSWHLRWPTFQRISLWEHSGLKEETKNELWVLDPKGLDQAMDLAAPIEEKLKSGKRKASWPDHTPKTLTLMLLLQLTRPNLITTTLPLTQSSLTHKTPPTHIYTNLLPRPNPIQTHKTATPTSQPPRVTLN